MPVFVVRTQRMTHRIERIARYSFRDVYRPDDLPQIH